MAGMLTRKHFVAKAKEISGFGDLKTRRTETARFIKGMRASKTRNGKPKMNPRFDRKRFITAAGAAKR